MREGGGLAGRGRWLKAAEAGCVRRGTGVHRWRGYAGSAQLIRPRTKLQGWNEHCRPPCKLQGGPQTQAWLAGPASCPTPVCTCKGPQNAHIKERQRGRWLHKVKPFGQSGLPAKPPAWDNAQCGPVCDDGWQWVGQRCQQPAWMKGPGLKDCKRKRRKSKWDQGMSGTSRNVGVPGEESSRGVPVVVD